MTFELNPEVEVHRDADGRVTQLRHTRRRYSSQEAGITNATPAQVAEQYVREVAGIYGIEADETTSLREAMPVGPVPEGPKLRQAEEKNIIDTTTVVMFQQTAYGLPVWNSNLTVVVAGESPAVVSSSSTLHHDIDLGALSIDRLNSFSQATPTSLREAIGVDDSVGTGFALNGLRLLVYRYDPAERIDPEARPADARGLLSGGYADSSPAAPSGQADAGYDPSNPRSGAGGSSPEGSSGQPDAGYDPAKPQQPGLETAPPTESPASDADAGFAPEGPPPPPPPAGGEEALHKGPPTLPLPPVPPSIVPGQHYVVQEVLFRLTLPGEPELNWRAFVEPESRAVLFLRALTASATCAVFETDPIAKTGVVMTAASPAATLDTARTLNLTLQNLNAPVGGAQHLSGTRTQIADIFAPNTPSPTTTTPFNFEYTAPSSDFGATNAYYHHDWMFRLVQGMGFNLAAYFNGATFPVPVDHAGMGSSVNAQAPGNATGNGIGRFLYGLVQSGQPMSMATQVGVCLHEFGHALLWDHVNSPNFGWCHSAGDTLAALMMDPGSKAPDRFQTFPFVMAGTPGIDRRHDRAVAAGWAWGGARDDRQYGSEQILSTTMFRVYRVTGGDDANINVQKFAARYLIYLILRAIGTLTATTTDPRDFVTRLQDADDLTVNFEGHAGGAWHKVIRWSFERQGLFQPAGAPTPVTQPGAPPDVDVFINDGRNGHYEPYLTNIGASPGVWNRLAADGGTTHQEPAAGVTNYLYVRVNNRGTQQAQNIAVKCYQGKVGTALNWPADWTALTTPSLPGPVIAAGGSTIIGPFQWTPAAAGPISVLASVSATGDASNADTVNGPISNRRLVPNDNNIAQRDFTASAAVAGMGIKIASGSTTPGSTNWQAYGTNGLYLDVDTSAGKFTTAPRYFTSIGGSSSQWATTGATSIYNATPTGFRVYVRFSDGSAITPAQANSFQWHINWLGVEE